MGETLYKTCIYCGKPIKYETNGKEYKAISTSPRKFCNRECYGKYVSMTKPSKRKDRLFHVWKGMRERCHYSNHASAKFYKDRGIKVCEEWENNFDAFKEWALANGYDYSKSRKEQSLDRIDNNKGYSPDNCRWVSMKVNNQNTRRNIFITYNGKTLCISDWSKELGVSIETIRNRLKKTDDPKLILSTSRVASWNRKETTGIRNHNGKYVLVIRQKYIGTFETFEEALERKKEYMASLGNMPQIYIYTKEINKWEENVKARR